MLAGVLDYKRENSIQIGYCLLILNYPSIFCSVVLWSRSAQCISQNLFRFCQLETLERLKDSGKGERNLLLFLSFQHLSSCKIQSIFSRQVWTPTLLSSYQLAVATSFICLSGLSTTLKGALQQSEHSFVGGPSEFETIVMLWPFLGILRFW